MHISLTIKNGGKEVESSFFHKKPRTFFSFDIAKLLEVKFSRQNISILLPLLLKAPSETAAQIRPAEDQRAPRRARRVVKLKTLSMSTKHTICGVPCSRENLNSLTDRDTEGKE